MHLMLILISNSNVTILKVWTKSSMNQEIKTEQIEYAEMFESIYKSQFHLYFLIINNQYILKV
jgi:hypothetical protein